MLKKSVLDLSRSTGVPGLLIPANSSLFDQSLTSPSFYRERERERGRGRVRFIEAESHILKVSLVKPVVYLSLEVMTLWQNPRLVSWNQSKRLSKLHSFPSPFPFPKNVDTRRQFNVLFRPISGQNTNSGFCALFHQTSQRSEYPGGQSRPDRLGDSLPGAPVRETRDSGC